MNCPLGRYASIVGESQHIFQKQRGEKCMDGATVKAWKKNVCLCWLLLVMEKKIKGVWNPMKRGIFRGVQMKDRKIQCFPLWNPGKVDKLAGSWQASHLCHYFSCMPMADITNWLCHFPLLILVMTTQIFLSDTYFKILGIDAQMKAQP